MVTWDITSARPAIQLDDPRSPFRTARPSFFRSQRQFSDITLWNIDRLIVYPGAIIILAVILLNAYDRRIPIIATP